MISLRHLWLGIGGHSWGAGHLPDEPLPAVVVDSRKAVPGSVFFALRGEHRDGHEFVADALARGAVAAVVSQEVEGVDRPVYTHEVGIRDPFEPPVLFRVPDTSQALLRAGGYWRAHFHPRVVGVTGSVGKTSTKEMIAAVLRRRFRTLWTPASYNNEIGIPLTLLRLGPEHEALVVEMGAYLPGDIDSLCHYTFPQVGVVTNVGVSHLERMGSVERIWEAKSELVRFLPRDGTAVLNWDDEGVRRMARVTRARVFSYGLTPEADLWADEVETLGLEGIRFTLHHGRDVVPVRLPILGRHSVHTALAAAAVGLVFGLEWEDILAGLGDPDAEVRIVVVPGIKGTQIVDDTYNASPASMLAALNLLADLDGRRVAILGDMLELGSYEEVGHRKVGARAAEVVDRLIAVGERARWIAEEAIAAGMPPEHVVHVSTVEEAIEKAREWLQPGDIILIKASRAMALERVVEALSAPEEETSQLEG